MPVLGALRTRFAADRPLAGVPIAACLHVTAETAVLVRTLRAAGAEVRLCAANPLSTQDDVAAALVAEGVGVFARRGVDRAGYAGHVDAALDLRPRLVLDDGCDLTDRLHTARRELLAGVRGGTEATTTGVLRLRQLAGAGELRLPMVALDASGTRHLFDRYGTGQSSVDAVLRATNTLLAGRTVVVAGYGPCGQGIAERAAGMGAHVVVTEVDPVRALDATLAGHRVLPMAAAAPLGDVFLTATGDRDVLRAEHFAVMKDGAVLANAGHFNVEVDVVALAELAVARRPGVRPSVDEYVLADGRRLLLLAQGRLVNLAAAEGHPPALMDLGFADTALTAAWLHSRDQLDPGVYAVPREIDDEVARLALAASGVAIDTLTPAQAAYLASWQAAG